MEGTCNTHVPSFVSTTRLSVCRNRATKPASHAANRIIHLHKSYFLSTQPPNWWSNPTCTDIKPGLYKHRTQVVQTIRCADHLLGPVLEEGEKFVDVYVAPAVDSRAIVRAVVRLIEHDHMLPRLAQGFDVRRRIVNMNRGLHTIFQPGKAQAHVRNMVAVQPLRGVGNNHLMLAGHEQPMRDDANVHVLARQSLQRLRNSSSLHTDAHVPRLYAFRCNRRACRTAIHPRE